MADSSSAPTEGAKDGDKDVCASFFDYMRGTVKTAVETKKSLFFRIIERTSNYNTSSLVLERLLLRHAILKNLVEIEDKYDASQKYYPKTKVILRGAVYPNATNVVKEFEFDVDSERAIRTYRLATTDLFVEKAIAYLEYDYSTYVFKGNVLFLCAIIAIVFGVLASALLLLGWDPYWLVLGQIKVSDLHPVGWPDVVLSFIKGFTFYGFLVLLAVQCSRLGKAMMDQAERLRERRHSLRQGRLYVHLSNGEVTVEELEKAFDWNVSKGNAFGNIPTESLAPWGAVLREAIRAIPEVFKKARGVAQE